MAGMRRRAHSRATGRFTLALPVILAVLLSVQLFGLWTQQGSNRAASSRTRLVRDIEQIRYYDELLTMSARLAASSGDTEYIARYHAAAPELDRVIADALAAAPTEAAVRALAQVDSANRALVALEERDFVLVAAGHRADAYAQVTSAGYLRLKIRYRAGMDAAIAQLQSSQDRIQTRTRRQQLISVLLGVLSAALLLSLWVATARGLRRSQFARRVVEDQLRQQAHSDPLTGLPNRRLFRERLSAALSLPPPGRLALLFIDLDNFKVVNDTRGHADGDTLLVEVAERLTDLLYGRGQSVVARLGGDEFAVLLPVPSADAAERFADRLVASLARPFACSPHTAVTASVGLALAAPGRQDAGELLRGADLAMYDAKFGGRNRWSRYDEQMHTDLLDRVALEAELREGLHRGELCLHYQPIFHLRSGERVGVEALCRWQHPARGLVSPVVFIPVAERSGLINELGRFVLERACQQLATWSALESEDPPSYVSVNVSAGELLQPGYATQVLAVLCASGLQPTSLVLEITESEAIPDHALIITVLTELRAAGIRIAIDDFGTGHSSLARLQQLPADIVKVDRAFLLGLPGQAHDGAATLDMLVALARSHELDLIAEGIETSHQLDTVRDSGCTYGQGFLLGRPHPQRTAPTTQTIP
jgi:diguanylate cyclase (GGDEF)-like protein